MSIKEAKRLLQYAMQNYGTGDCLKKAEELFLHSAEQGNTEAMCCLGDIYYWMADEEMYREAFAWYQKAVCAGDERALARIGWCYCKGHGTEKDIVRGIRCLEQAVSRGSVAAMVKLGMLFLSGQEVEKSSVNAAEMFDKAEKRGSKTARWYLAGCLERGDGVEQNIYKALDLYRINAANGDGKSLHRVLDLEAELRDRDSEWSFARLKGLAKAGEPLSQYLLGEAYEKGIGTRKNYEEAAKWYRLAADQNLAEAQYSLACCYVNGYGVEKDEEKAGQLFHFAANIWDEQSDAILDEEGELFYFSDIFKHELHNE